MKKLLLERSTVRICGYAMFHIQGRAAAIKPHMIRQIIGTRFVPTFLIGTLILGIFIPLQASATEPHQEVGDRKGAWRERSQLVWDTKRENLVRRVLRVWDPHNDERLEFYWERDSGSLPTAVPIIAGSGKLTWRIKGTPRYDASGIVRTYVGELQNGRPHGKGRLEVRDGLMYQGDWRRGVMHGPGEIRHPDGGHYVGAFWKGKPHGKGRVAYANGEIHEGTFSRGLPDGQGRRTLADGREIESVWKAGVEMLGRPAVIPANWSQSEIEYAQWAGNRDRV